MSINGDTNSQAGFDATEHQAAYVYNPTGNLDSRGPRSTKRKVEKLKATQETHEPSKTTTFIPLLNGHETLDHVNIRKSLFNQTWSETEKKIRSILNETNEDTLNEVSLFVQKDQQEELRDRISTSFIVTGPNITSQDLLFEQLSERLSREINGPVITLRSGDATNLRACLKKLIRDATNQRPNGEEEESLSIQQDGRKLLNYDLDILHGYVVRNKCSRVVVSVQDSEAFDTGLLVELIVLFSSWLDRIPFVLLFGVATSVEFFRERLPRKAARCLYGAEFNVEHASSILERLFQKVVSGTKVPLRIGAGLVSCLMERQSDHIQSVQAFISALKYAYMCHFFANPLSILLEFESSASSLSSLQQEHFELVRTLPSFRKLIERLLEEKDTRRARSIIEDDETLIEEIKRSMRDKTGTINGIIQRLAILSLLGTGSVGEMELYMLAFTGDLNDSSLLRNLIDSIKTATPENLTSLTSQLARLVKSGRPEVDLEGWENDCPGLYNSLLDINKNLVTICDAGKQQNRQITSKYSVQKMGLRTTGVAQKVQQSQQAAALSKLDIEFTQYLDDLQRLLKDYLTFPNPLDIFMNEIWLYEFKSPYRDVFTPRPKFVVERALSIPHDYLGCECCNPSLEGLSSTQPPTAILYQLYLETGSLINVYDLWSAFFAIIGSEDGEGYGEREALMLFYRALADLKSLGMIKQSRKKTDHLAKLSWKGL
ncbi:origin recognition complex subunit 3 N-terminus-domain-containing protein [Xylogone sp. PMI_703]|nr:origin recognition complex subunit 3 N-terminus-domain-containing protein [Xylogone sp. PMI_703]